MCQLQIKLSAISLLVCTQRGFCRCDYRGDYSAAFCVFGPQRWMQTNAMRQKENKTNFLNAARCNRYYD